ncbi:MAG: TRAM domain-containing protein, partial [Dehalococcoidia bacterium]
LSTDVIVGFCGETEAQFQRTLDLLAQIRFDKVHVAAYSPRPGTVAWRHLEDDVPHDEKMRRLHAVEALQEGIGNEINRQLLGTTQEVLVEGERDGVLTGRTRTNKLVHFPGHSHLGRLVDVRIEKASPWALQGLPVGSQVALIGAPVGAPVSP